MLRVVSLAVKAAALAGLGVAVVHACRKCLDNAIVVYIYERIILPPEATDSFTELSYPIAGEVRLATNLVAKSTFYLRLNASLLGDSKHRSGGGGNASGTSGRSGATRVSNVASDAEDPAAASRSGGWQTVDLDGTGSNVFNGSANSSGRCGTALIRNPVLNDVCNTLTCFGASGNSLLFTPACVASMILLQYESSPSEVFRVPLSIRDAVVEPGAFRGAFRLSFDLVASDEVFYTNVNFVFPKGCRIVSYHHQNVGVFRASSALQQAAAGARSSEMVWEIGTFLKAEAHKHASSRSSPAAGMQHAVLPEDTVVYRRAAPDFGSHIAQVRFEVTYSLVNEAGALLVPADDDGSDASDDGDSPRGAASAGGPKKANRRERRAAARAAGNLSRSSPNYKKGVQADEELADAHNRFASPNQFLPGVSVSYSTASTASGLEVRKLEPRNTTFNWAPDVPASLTRLSAGLDWLLRPKLRKEISVVTSFSQIVKVESRL